MKIISERDTRFIIGMLIIAASVTLMYWTVKILPGWMILPLGIVNLMLLLVAAKVSRVPERNNAELDR